MQRLKVRDQRQQRALVRDQIDFIEQQKCRRARFLHHIERVGIGFIPPPLGIDDQQNQRAALERLSHLRHHLAAKRRAGLVHAGSVNQHDLSTLAPLLLGDVDDSENTVARSLGLGRDDRELLADQRIEQRALASIRRPRMQTKPE